MECHPQTAEIQLTAVGTQSTKQKRNFGAIHCPPKYSLKELNYKTLYSKKRTELKNAVQETGCSFHTTGKPTY